MFQMYSQLVMILLCAATMCVGRSVSFDDIEPQAVNRDTFDMSQLSDEDRALIRNFDRGLNFVILIVGWDLESLFLK